MIPRSLFAMALLGAAACGAPEAEPPLERGSQELMSTQSVPNSYNIFTHQTPTEYLDAAPGWEISTTFSSSISGRITGCRLYKAPGETGTHTCRIWSDSGQLLASATYSNEPASGWMSVTLPKSVNVTPGTEYRVSHNTNTQQAKTPGGLSSPITHYSLTATGSSYGQPTGGFPTSGSQSLFFSDVRFVPYKPDLVFGSAPTLGQDYYGNWIIQWHTCNYGDTSSEPFTTRIRYSFNNVPQWTNEGMTPSLAAGQCILQGIRVTSSVGYNLWEFWLDPTNAIDESNENNNYQWVAWNRAW
jgi:hypothetical protein